MAHSLRELHQLVLDFTEAFNRDDLEAVMSYFAEDAFYDEFHGRRSQGKPAIREAFEPQFSGAYGRIRFRTEDVFAEPESGKAVVRWLCVIERDGRKSAWRGLDVLRFRDGKLVSDEKVANRRIVKAAR